MAAGGRSSPTPRLSYSSAPELMLTAIARATRRMRVGHSAVLAPIKVKHPIRIAERAAFLDHKKKMERYPNRVASASGSRHQGGLPDQDRPINRSETR